MTSLIRVLLIVFLTSYVIARAQEQTPTAVQSVPCRELPRIRQLESLPTRQVLAAFGYDLRQPYDCSKMQSHWYGDNLVLLFRSIPTRLDDQTRFALVIFNRPHRVFVIPIASGMLEYPRVESDPHNLAAFNLILATHRNPDSETEWKSLGLSYLALIGHGAETSNAKVSCEKTECTIQLSERQKSAMAVIAWTLTFNSQGKAPRLEDVSRDVQATDK